MPPESESAGLDDADVSPLPAAIDELLDHRTLPPHRRARIVLVAFVLTFLASRVLVLMIMTRRMPDLFLNVGQTHVHHLNYGIFLVCVVGGYSLFAKPMGPRLLPWALRIFGVGLALTFDEFGMWLHLGGGYWQRASYDAVVLVSSVLALIAFMPSIRRFHAIHWSMALAIIVAGLLLAALLLERLHRFGASMGPWLENIERTGPQ